MDSNSDSGTRFVTQIPIQKRILIIDDEEDITIALRTVLEEYGFKTDSYTDPLLAHENFKYGKYDLVILDIKMPVFDGFLLYQKLKKIDNNVKICFLTASEYFRKEIRKEHGFDEFNQELFLRKPVEINELVNVVEKLLKFG